MQNILFVCKKSLRWAKKWDFNNRNQNKCRNYVIIRVKSASLENREKEKKNSLFEKSFATLNQVTKALIKVESLAFYLCPRRFGAIKLSDYLSWTPIPKKRKIYAYWSSDAFLCVNSSDFEIPMQRLEDIVSTCGFWRKKRLEWQERPLLITMLWLTLIVRLHENVREIQNTLLT